MRSWLVSGSGDTLRYANPRRMRIQGQGDIGSADPSISALIVYVASGRRAPSTFPVPLNFQRLSAWTSPCHDRFSPPSGPRTWMVSVPAASLKAVRTATSRLPSPLGENGFGVAWMVTVGPSATTTDATSRVLVVPARAVARSLPDRCPRRHPRPRSSRRRHHGRLRSWSTAQFSRLPNRKRRGNVALGRRADGGRRLSPLSPSSGPTRVTEGTDAEAAVGHTIKARVRMAIAGADMPGIVKAARDQARQSPPGLLGAESCCTAQVVPSGSLKKTNDSQGNSWTLADIDPLPKSSARAAWTSLTTTSSSAEPGLVAEPGAERDRAGRPRWRELNEPEVVVDLGVLVFDEADLLGAGCSLATDQKAGGSSPSGRTTFWKSISRWTHSVPRRKDALPTGKRLMRSVSGATGSKRG